MKLSRIILSGAIAGATLVGSAWAGTGLVPVSVPDPTSLGGDPASEEATVAIAGDATSIGSGALVGASKLPMDPRPADFGGRWEQDAEKCERMSENTLAQLAEDTDGEVDHLVTPGSPWPENPDCIYMGGFDIGPANPIIEFDQEYGLWVRSIAIGDGVDTIVLTIIDAEGYLWDYASKCDRCGAKQLGEDLGTELELPSSSFVIAATHSHSAPEFLGGWGFVPDWYMTQITETIKDSVRAAVADMEPARIEIGEVLARPHNSERRDTYRSAEEQQLAWFRAIDQHNETIATVGTYAAHPTTRGTNDGIATSDWVGPFEKRLEERFGGIGFHFMTGLGNMSASGAANEPHEPGHMMGKHLADLVPETGTPLSNTDLRIAQTTWQQPATNVPLTALGLPGFFDRKFIPTPSSVTTGKSPDTAPCTSASAATVELSATAMRIGELALTTSPGEVFANLTNTIKDKSGALVTMPLAQANDALGYMPQSFEMSPIGQQGLGFVAGGVLIVNYEDSYSIDRCVGDMVLETALELLNNL